ncbi:unnamed protein product [Phyllotreta striolata]|uniref:Putative inorganic phosphate cotransporter n=1 Tax=Phyllotreta striolata TaxID=444603 RepID=A0A9N9XK61_PHYSR|nr:unnamed protein product [Phyllotreta striolata]
MSDETNTGPIFGKRHVQYILLFTLKILAYSTRYNLSIAILAMTERTSSNPDIPYYDWPNSSVVLSSFFWGYVVLQIPAGALGMKFGAKNLLLLAMAANSTLALLTPLAAARLGAGGVIACRALQGLAQGVFFPLSSTLQAKWVPVEERARVGGLMFSGSTLGLVVTYSLTGCLCRSSWGWPSNFYLFGALGVAWSALYYCLGRDGPGSVGSITREERVYIERSLGVLDYSRNARIPWKAILTSLPVWTIFCTSLGNGWGSATVMSEMPTYFDKVLKFDINSNGLLSSLQYIANFLLTYVMGFSSDYLINKGYLSTINARRMFNSIGSFATGVLLLIFGYLPENTDRYVAVALLVASTGVHSAISSGYSINHYDLSPNFAGTIMGVMNEGEELLSIVTPLAVQYVVTDLSDRDQWRIIIVTGSAMYFVSGAIFAVFATADRQWWNDGVYNDLA